MSKVTILLSAIFCFFAAIIVFEFYYFYSTSQKAGKAKGTLYSSCLVLPEKFCLSGRIRKLDNKNQSLVFTLPAGTMLFSPWDGIIYLNKTSYLQDPSTTGRKTPLPAVFLHPPLKTMEKDVLKKKTFVIIGQGIKWLVADGEEIKKGQSLGKIEKQLPLLLSDKFNLIFGFADYKGQTVEVVPNNFGSFFQL